MFKLNLTVCHSSLKNVANISQSVKFLIFFRLRISKIYVDFDETRLLQFHVIAEKNASLCPKTRDKQLTNLNPFKSSDFPQRGNKDKNPGRKSLSVITSSPSDEDCQILSD